MADKITKEQAHYRENAPPPNNCENCTMFRKPGSCTLVKGFIFSKGTCKYFEEKK